MTGITVSELCLGTSTFARYTDLKETFALLDAFRGVGGNFLQTSGICPGASLGDGFLGLPEDFFGRWLKSRGVRRDEIVIATRMGFARPFSGGAQAYGELMLACAQDSLRRLGVEQLDFLVIEWSEALLPLNESLAAIDAVVRGGAARHAIIAHFPPEHLDTTWQCQSPLLAGVQLDYSLVYRSLFENGPATFCRQRGLGFMARSPLAGGHLVARPPPQLGSFRWRSADDPAVAMSAHTVWPALRVVARAHDCAPAQVALAWVLNRANVTSTLVSVRSALQLDELIAATGLLLPVGEAARLEAEASKGLAHLTPNPFAATAHSGTEAAALNTPSIRP